MAGEITEQKLPTEEITPSQWRKRLTYAVLGSLSLSDNIPEQMPSDVVYSVFYQLKPKYPRFLGSLNFQRTKYATGSKELEDILFYLGAFGLVTVENHDFRCLRFSDKDKEATKDNMQKRMANDNSLAELKDLSNDFAKLFRSQTNTCTK